MSRVPLSFIVFNAAIAMISASVGLLGCVPGNGDLGSSCREKEECKSRLCLQETRFGAATGWQDGYCTEPCETGCESGRCVTLNDGSYCLKGCTQNVDCRDGYICHPMQNVCLPSCQTGWSCGDDFSCGQDGICLDHTSAADGGLPGLPSDQPIGAPCQNIDNCATEYCIKESLTQTGIAWQNGMCSAECGVCPQGTRCIDLAATSVCLPHCTESATCRTGYVCNWQVAACMPDCRLGFECGPDLRCNGRGICSAGTGYGK